MKHRRLWRTVYVLLPVAGVTLFLFCRTLLADILHGLSPCLFYHTLGLYCPGCGISRSLLRLMQGDVIASLRFHLLPIMALILGGLLYAEWGTVLFGTHRRLIPRSGRFWIVFGIVAAVYLVFRNVVELMPVS